MSEAKLSAGNAPIIGENADSPGQNQFGSVAKVLQENLECDKEASLVTESSSESNMSSTGDRQRQDQASPLDWTEPKRERRIQTTSLLLRRKKKDKRRHKEKPVLRLRGGCGDDEMDDGTHSNDEEDNDDDGEGNYQQDKGKPQQNFTSDGGKASCVEGDEKDARKESEMDIVKDPMSQVEGGKDAASRTDDDNASGVPKAADREAGDENDTKEVAGRKSKRQRQDYQKYKDDMWWTNFNDTSREVVVPEDSFDDDEWVPEEKKKKVYEESTSDDEGREMGKKKSKRQKKTLPPGNKPLSPVIQAMLEKLAIEKADVSKERLTLNKLAASLVIHRWARKTNFPLLQQQLLPRHFREILSDYGRIGSGVISTTAATLKTCWQKHNCHDDSKLHKQCYMCEEETWGEFANDGDVSLARVLDFDNVSKDENADVGVNQNDALDAPPSLLPSTLSGSLDVTDQEQHPDPCSSFAKDFQELQLSPNDVLKMIATLRAKEEEIEQLKAALNNFEPQHLTEGLENGTKSVSKELVTPNVSKDLAGTEEHKTAQFRCSLCEARYENYVSLVRHCRKKHKTEPEKPEKDYECDVCGNSFRERQVLQQHKKSVHNKPICTICSKPQSNLIRHMRFCETKKKKRERKKNQCPNCNREFINLPSHLKLCLPKNTQPPPAMASSLTHQERFGLPMTIAEQEQEEARLRKIAELAAEMELVSATIASREGISLKEGIKTFAAGQCLPESVAAQLLHRRLQDGDDSGPLVFQSLVDQLINIEGKEREDLEQVIRFKVVDFLWDNDLALDRFVYNPPGLANNEYVPPAEKREAYQQQLNDLRRKDQYAMSAGDLMIDGISAALGVNILIMRIDTPDNHPFDLHTPTALGGQLREESPIFLMFSEARSHFEEARPADAASEAKLLVIQQTFASHGFWPFKYKSGERIDLLSRDLPPKDRGQNQSSCSEQKESVEDDTNPNPENERSLPLKTPKKRKLYSEKQGQLPEVFSPEDDPDPISIETAGGDLEESCEASQVDGSGDRRRERQDEDFLQDLTDEEKANFLDLRGKLEQAVRDLPAFLEELKKVRMGDEMIEQKVREYKDGKDCNDVQGELHKKKFAQKETVTLSLWLAQMRSKIFPFLHAKYPGIDLSILFDFKEEIEHTNYHRADPPTTKKLHKFTLADMKESLISTYNSLTNPGPSKHQLVMSWAALCRAMAWHAKNDKVFFADRNDAIDTISHYEEAADMIGGANKAFKGYAATKRAEDQLQGKVSYESHELAQGVQKWFKSEERERLRVMLDECSDKVVTPSQYVQLQELVHTEMVVSSPFRSIVWRDFPYRGLAEGWQNPGWDPNFISDRPEESIETITEDGISIKITNDITRPPPSLACEHQSKDPHCTCPDACPPSGYNVLLTWDKGSSQPTKRNRYLHLPKPLYDMMSKFATIRDRYFSSVLKNGPSGEEPENWYLGLCPLLLNSAGKQDKQFSMTMASKIMEMDVTPHMFRRLFCTFLAHHDMKAVRTAQPQVCGHSASVFLEYYDLNTKRDGQNLMQTTYNWHSVGDTSSQSDEHAKECQKRVNMEKERIQEVNKQVEQLEEPLDNHSHKNPILKSDLTLLLKTAIRMRVDVITSHPAYDEGCRTSLGDPRMSREVWKKQFLKLALKDSSNGELMREVLLHIFEGRPEPIRHKWSLRESMMKRQADASKKGKVPQHLKDPIWILLDSINTSITSKLKMANKAISSGTWTSGQLDSCLCAKLPSTFNCIHCDQPVCDRCSR